MLAKIEQDSTIIVIKYKFKDKNIVSQPASKEYIKYKGLKIKKKNTRKNREVVKTLKNIKVRIYKVRLEIELKKKLKLKIKRREPA